MALWFKKKTCYNEEIISIIVWLLDEKILKGMC